MGDKTDRSWINRDYGCFGESEAVKYQSPEFNENEEWVLEYIEQFGEKPTFF